MTLLLKLFIFTDNFIATGKFIFTDGVGENFIW